MIVARIAICFVSAILAGIWYHPQFFLKEYIPEIYTRQHFFADYKASQQARPLP
jgi:hypothetical protein